MSEECMREVADDADAMAVGCARIREGVVGGKRRCGYQRLFQIFARRLLQILE
eukprot:CAMPEP_0201946800 /NCGR_PEP_ID=MMETSP0903-20130614/54607_1 /ASSEMBLY_ACC=CAM_ASM_000552 /TAXON_ID=420261 /ORGANISM="Thalassiosira antarctica, Strain CCMP982" /LENGTH=52 /DNA_ID=CAMNT_0048489909 /DNA_START=930 /DNA_END=1088 /DNA_ORIENTATION=+